MKSIKKIHSNIIDTFKTKYIWVAMLLCMALFFGANVYGEDSTDATGQIINLIKLKNINLLAKGEEFSREFVFCCFNENYWFEVLFPIIAGLATTSRFADEWLNGMYYFTTSRIGKKYYAIIEVISCFIISFFTIIICLGIFQIIIWEKFPAISDYEDWKYSMIVFMQGETLKKRILYYLFMYIHMGFLSGIYALFSMLLVIIVKDRFFSVTIPVMIDYLSTKVENLFSIYIFKHNIPTSSIINYVNLFFPTTYFRKNSFFAGDNSYKSVIIYIVYLFLIVVLLSSIIIKLITGKDR